MKARRNFECVLSISLSGATFRTMTGRGLRALKKHRLTFPGGSPTAWGQTQVGGSKASTRSSNFETPLAAHRELASRSVYIVNRMTGVSGIAFFRIVAASAPFNRGIARSKRIKSGCSSKSRTDRRMEALSSAIRTVLATN